MTVIVTANALQAPLYSSSLDSLAAGCNGAVPAGSPRCEFLMGRRIQGREQDVPAFAVATRSAGKRRGKRQIEGRDFPLVFCQIAFSVQPVRLEEIGRGIVLAMFVLHAGEERE